MSESPLPGPVLSIELDAVAHNTRLVAGRAGGELMAVVKADGFGHGAYAVAATALTHGATSLGVTSIAEAVALRDAGIIAPILSWLNAPGADFGAAIAGDVQVAVPSVEHLQAVATAADVAGRPAPVHLHADTGMARDGASPSEWSQLCERAAAAEQQGRIEVVGLMGHLPCADVPGIDANAEGRVAFERFVDIARRAGLHRARRHLAAPAATLTDPSTHYDLCRVGAGLVGIDPTGSTGLRTAMTIRSPLISVRTVSAGTGIGYGHTHVTHRETRLGLVGLGYADGIPRSASDRAQVLVHGHRCRVVGLVSMDQIVIDLGEADARPGDPVVVMGPGDHGEPTVDEWAQWAATLPHDIVTGFGPRLARTTVPPASPRLRALPATIHRSTS